MQLQHELQEAYGNVNDIDAFEGGLARTPVPGSIFGPMFQRIIAGQAVPRATQAAARASAGRASAGDSGSAPSMMQVFATEQRTILISRGGAIASGLNLVVARRPMLARAMATPGACQRSERLP